jgi:hypothetical protein
MLPIFYIGAGIGLVVLALGLVAILATVVAPKYIRAQGLGGLGTEETIVATNRTGGTLTVGGVYALDRAQADAASTSAELGAGNIIAVATANMHHEMVIATAALADDATGSFVIASSNVQALVETTTNITKGDQVCPVNAQAYLKNQSTSVLTLGCGIANETRITDDTGLISISFDGRRRFCSKNPVS